MQVQETERTAGYRFWFDVREPGAAAYASQLGAHAMYLALLSLVPNLGAKVGFWFMVPGFLLVAGLMGALRRLELWAAMVMGVAMVIPVVGSAVLASRGYWVYAAMAGFLFLILCVWGLPMAIWAAWVHRGLRAEERWDLVGLPAVRPGTPRWKLWVAVWWGAARPW